MSINWQGLLGQGATTAAQYEMLESAKRDAGQIPGQIKEGLETLSGMARPYTEFKPFTVTSPTGAMSTVGPQGMTSNLSAQQQQLVDSLQQQATTQAGMIGQVTPEQLMSQMQALRAPQQQRDQQALEERLAAQGRLGVQTAAYGGTPEQLAMQKAMQEQQSADSLAAIQGARTLQGQDISNLTSMLGASFMPENQALASLSPAIQTQQIASGLNQTQANLIGQLGKQYLAETGLAGQTQAQLSQQQANALIQNLLGNTMGTAEQPSSFLGQLGSGLFDYVGGLFSGGNVDWAVDPQSAVRAITGEDIERLTGGPSGAQTTVYNPSTGISVTGTAGRTGGVNLPPTGPGGI